jgi:hypothetical protein
MSLDTRGKILTLEQVRALAPGVVQESIAFVTHMEVLQASHIRRLEGLASAVSGKLFVILTDPESPLVPMEARAELAAALRIVDYVVPAPQGASAALVAIQPIVMVADEEEDRERTRLLVEHVRSRARS